MHDLPRAPRARALARDRHARGVAAEARGVGGDPTQRGDLVAEITVETPTKLSKRQKEILEEFRETETGEECPESQGFFGKLRTMFAE